MRLPHVSRPPALNTLRGQTDVVKSKMSYEESTSFFAGLERTEGGGCRAASSSSSSSSTLFATSCRRGQSLETPTHRATGKHAPQVHPSASAPRANLGHITRLISLIHPRCEFSQSCDEARGLICYRWCYAEGGEPFRARRRSSATAPVETCMRFRARSFPSDRPELERACPRAAHPSTSSCLPRMSVKLYEYN